MREALRKNSDENITTEATLMEFICALVFITKWFCSAFKKIFWVYERLTEASPNGASDIKRILANIITSVPPEINGKPVEKLFSDFRGNRP